MTVSHTLNIKNLTIDAPSKSFLHTQPRGRSRILRKGGAKFGTDYKHVLFNKMADSQL